MLLLLFNRISGTNRILAAIWATLTASLLFSLFHYVGPSAENFTGAGFLQRTLGGIYFSVLFVTRGFGVTAATHALYDFLVGLLIP
jgi:membrane protease YdiL (CAAX protease family)